MRRRFFVDQVRNGHAEISGQDARHLTRVLRVEAGQRYEISDNRNVYLAVVQDLDQRILPPAQAQLHDLVERELCLVGSSIQLPKTIQSNHGVFHAEDVRDRR